MPLLDGLRKLFGGREEIRMPRRWPRIVMTETSLLTLPGNRREPVKIANLSAGGVRVLSSFALPQNQRVTINLPLAAGSKHSIAAHVVWIRRDQQSLHYLSGLSFVGAGSEGIPEVLAFVEDEQRRRMGARDFWRG
jgi:hypothetical protein